MSALRSHVLLVGLMLCVLAPAGAGARAHADSAWELGPRRGRGECLLPSDGFLLPRAVWRSKLSPHDATSAAGPRAVWRDLVPVQAAAAAPSHPAPPARDGRDTHLRIGVLLI